ncbi:MAG: hypothetical protein KFB97_04505 [Cyanobium sp. M30B3]|nr:MAG: hypothetical protein KFB97_13540 [Cyanobium sp. M30B3]QVL53267.1 MAG: hypothetical protein KFB97_02330 [Cyanobium sp. M30B3]QVL53630.1 MAG: hypothetical protein KFB97_04505 [Cyanobium sp. M30B3]
MTNILPNVLRLLTPLLSDSPAYHHQLTGQGSLIVACGLNTKIELPQPGWIGHSLEEHWKVSALNVIESPITNPNQPGFPN